jgi:hypothetical protein
LGCCLIARIYVILQTTYQLLPVYLSKTFTPTALFYIFAFYTEYTT